MIQNFHITYWATVLLPFLFRLFGSASSLAHYARLMCAIRARKSPSTMVTIMHIESSKSPTPTLVEETCCCARLGVNGEVDSFSTAYVAIRKTPAYSGGLRSLHCPCVVRISNLAYCVSAAYVRRSADLCARMLDRLRVALVVTRKREKSFQTWRRW